MWPTIGTELIGGGHPIKSRYFFKLRAMQQDYWHGFVPADSTYQIADVPPLLTTFTSVGAYVIQVPQHRYGTAGLRIRMVGSLSLSWPRVGLGSNSMPGTKGAQVRLSYTDGDGLIHKSNVWTISSIEPTSYPANQTAILTLVIPEFLTDQIGIAVEMMAFAQATSAGWTVTSNFTLGQAVSGLRCYIATLPALTAASDVS
jgi:hypothetical protein